MNKLILFLFSIILCTRPAWPNQQCFIAKENAKVLTKEGDCNKRYSPYSSFKIALSIIGYDSGFLIRDEKNQIIAVYNWSVILGSIYTN